MPNSIALPADLGDVKEMLQSALDAQGEIPVGFNLDQWLQEWLQRPQPALGGARPVVRWSDVINVIIRQALEPFYLTSGVQRDAAHLSHALCYRVGMAQIRSACSSSRRWKSRK